MPTTGDPLAEHDEELRRLCAELAQARARREHATAERLTAFIDQLLDERSALLTGQPSHTRCDTAAEHDEASCG